MSGGTGVLLCGHGSRDEAAVEEFRALATGVAERLPDCRVETGFLEFARPSIDEGLDRLREAGYRRVVAVPGLLFAAGHVKRDIPALLAAYQNRHPETRIRFGRALGLDPKMKAAAHARIAEALDRAGATVPRRQTALLVVGRGAAEPKINAEVVKLTDLLRRNLGFARGETAYAGLAEPGVELALKEVGKLGCRRLVVFPYLLLTGVLVTRIHQLADAAAARNPELDVVKASYLGGHPLVLDTFVERVQELRVRIA